MIACLVGNSARLAELAGQFSPVMEEISKTEVVFSIDGLESLLGNIHQIAAEIARCGAQMQVSANLALAVNKTTAQLAARHYCDVTIVEVGQEAKILAELPIEALPASPDMVETLMRWGIRTMGNLAALPESGVKERLGESGSRLRRIALGRDGDVISIRRETQEYAIKRELDDGIEQLEHLLFVVSAQLHELTERLSHDGRAASAVILTLTLDREVEFVRSIEFPLATRDPLAILKQLQLSLDADPPSAGILAVQTELKPTGTSVVQSGLFQAAAPEPDKLQTLLARLAAVVGKDNVGSPEILNSHRPDPVRLRPCAFEPGEALPGTPDLVFPEKRVVIFVHGCFWHRHECKSGRSWPQTRTEFWQKKLSDNRNRDLRNVRRIRELSWNVIVVWECQLKGKDINRALRRVLEFRGKS